MISEVSHHYGKHVHILDDKYLSSMLARLCQPQTHQPVINELVEFLYTDLIRVVLNNEFPTVKSKVPTRMTTKHPNAFLEADVLDTSQRAVSVNLARAGTFPSHICYNALNYILNPELVRQDHVTAARTTDENHRVTGTALGGSKIGGDVEGTIVLFPDPMGATGGTLVSALDCYKTSVKWKAKKYIALHLIITPEYLKRLSKSHPDLIIYAVRLDRGLSNLEILKTVPGERWDEERGLDDTHYIVPGGGGFGEILNNSLRMIGKMAEELRILKSSDEIQKRVGEIGRELTKKFKGKEPICICVLSGSFMFYSDLIRRLELDVTCEFLGVSTYKNQKFRRAKWK